MVEERARRQIGTDGIGHQLAFNLNIGHEITGARADVHHGDQSVRGAFPIFNALRPHQTARRIGRKATAGYKTNASHEDQSWPPPPQAVLRSCVTWRASGRGSRSGGARARRSGLCPPWARFMPDIFLSSTKRKNTRAVW